MVHQLLTVSYACDQTRVQLGDAVWRQYCVERGVLKEGKNADTSNDALFRCFFEQINGGLFVRNLSLDLEPNVIGNGSLANLFHPEFLLYGTEDAENNFARGHYTVRKEIIDKVNDRMKKLVNHSVGGDPGSVVGTLILQRLAVDLKFIQVQQLVLDHFDSFANTL